VKRLKKTSVRKGREPAWRRLLWPGLFTLLAVAILCSLGVWQVHRLAWKEDLIARVEARTSAADAAPLPAERDWAKVGPEHDEYRRVKATGRYLYDSETFAYALVSDPKGKFSGPGYWVMTPLLRENGSIVIVNRGFVPLDRMDLPTRVAGQENAKVTVVGLLRLPEHRAWFTPADDPVRKIWQERDPALIAKTFELSHVAPFFIDAIESGPDGLPQGGETRLTFANDHLQYAITWFGLALAAICVFFIFARREFRRPAALEPRASRA
jgi:surfeit locus 1 family protein